MHAPILMHLPTYCMYPTCHWRRQWHPTPVLLPGKSHGWRSLVGCSPWDHEESDTTEQLHFHFSLSRIGEGNGNPLQCYCLENPRDGGAWWASVCGVAQSRTRLKRLSSSCSSNMSFDLCPLPVLLFWYHSDLRSFIYFSCSFSGSFPDLSNPVDSLVWVLLWKFGEQFWCNNVCSSMLRNFTMISLTISFLFSLFSLFSTTSLFQGQLNSSFNYICKVPLPCKVIYS